MSNGQGQQDDKNSMQILWIIFGIFAIGAAIWWGFSEQLKYAFIKLRVVELYILYFFSKLISFGNLESNIYNNLLFAQGLTVSNLNGDSAEYISEYVGSYLRYPFSLLLIYCGYIIYGKNVKMRYKKRYNMDTLAKQEQDLWPQIKPVLGLDLASQDLDEGAWAMGQTPMYFAKKQQLLTISLGPPLPGKPSNEPSFIAKLDHGKAEQAFAAQLGRPWQGPERMPIHRRALFATFIARGCRDTENARGLIDQMNRSIGTRSEIDFTEADNLWKKHYNTRAVQAICQSHGYEFTLMTSLFLFAREDGVFPTSDFLWLKPLDRRFWYVLNNVGRQTPSVEAAGVHAHWLAEKSIGRALSVPMVEEAVKALEFAVNEIIYKPSDEERDALITAANERRE